MPIFRRHKSPEEIAGDRELRNRLWLVKNGVPFDIAFELDPHEVFAWCIIFSEFNGGKFNWETYQWDEPEA